MDQIKIGSFISELRKAKGITQAEMAERLGVSNKSVSRWETGRNMPDVAMFIPLCEFLDISVNELIIGEKIEENIEEKTTEVIIDTIEKSSKKINAARSILYIAVLVVEIGLCIALSLTATPSDAMAVPLGGLLIMVLSAVVIGFIDIKMLYKLFYVPLSLLIFTATQLLYWQSMDIEEFFLYSVAILIGQMVVMFIATGIMKLIKRIKKG